MTDPRDRLADTLAERYLLAEELGRGASATVSLTSDRVWAPLRGNPEFASLIGPTP